MSRAIPNADFWIKMDELIACSEIIIDRPAGSVHPDYSKIIYPLDYGYLNHTSSSDGEGIDLWIGTGAEKKLTAVFVTVDLLNRDAEIKLMLGCTQEEIQIIDHFYNDYDTMKGLLIYREEAI